jgi:hypothetical protein
MLNESQANGSEKGCRFSDGSPIPKPKEITSIARSGVVEVTY